MAVKTLLGFQLGSCPPLEANAGGTEESSMTTLPLRIPRETALKLRRLPTDNQIDGFKAPWQFCSVPGQRHPDKTTLAVYLPRTLMQRLRRLARERGETVTNVVEGMVTAQTRDVVLTPEDYEQIAMETRLAQFKRLPRASE